MLGPAPAAEAIHGGPLSGAYRGATWDTQGLFAARASTQMLKMLAVRRLFQHHDFVMLTETHSNGGGLLGYYPPTGAAALWSSGTAARAGVDILLKDGFVKQFACQPTAWEESSPGRLARLRLSGSQGRLDLVVGYFPTGARRPWAGQRRRDLHGCRNSRRTTIRHHSQPRAQRTSASRAWWTALAGLRVGRTRPGP